MGMLLLPEAPSYHSDKSDTEKKKLSQSASSSNGKSNQTDLNNILKKPAYKNTGFPWICSEGLQSLQVTLEDDKTYVLQDQKRNGQCGWCALAQALLEDPEQWFTVKLSLLNHLRQIQEDRKVAGISWQSAANAASAPEDWLESLADDAIWHQEIIKRYSDEHAWLDEPVLWQVEKVYTNAHFLIHCKHVRNEQNTYAFSRKCVQTVNEDGEHKQVCFHYQKIVPVPPLGADTAAQSIGLSESHPVITPVSRHLPVYVKPTFPQYIDVRWNDTMSVVKIDHDYLDVAGKPVPTVTKDVLPVAFSKWEDFKRLIPKTDLKTHDSLDQATTRGTQLHNERATWYYNAHHNSCNATI
eukprot:g31708.t1